MENETCPDMPSIINMSYKLDQMKQMDDMVQNMTSQYKRTNDDSS